MRSSDSEPPNERIKHKSQTKLRFLNYFKILTLFSVRLPPDLSEFQTLKVLESTPRVSGIALLAVAL